MGCLDEAVIAAPCPVEWDSMVGDDRVRHCCGCAKNVYNIADMTKSEAEDFLEENGTTQCMRIFRRTDGTIMTDNCPRALRAIRNKLKLYWKIVAGMAATFFAFVPLGKSQSASAQQAQQPTAQEQHSDGSLRGDIYIPPPLKESKSNPANMELSGKPMAAPVTQTTPTAPANNLYRESKGDSAYVGPQTKGHKQIMLGNEGCQSSGSKQATPAGAAAPAVHPRMGQAVIQRIPQNDYTVNEAGIPKKSDSRAYRVYMEGKTFEAQGKLLLAQGKYKEAINFAKTQDQGDPKFLAFLQQCLKNLESKLTGTVH